MSNLTTLYDVRERIGGSRQPRHRSRLGTLRSDLNALGALNPYFDAAPLDDLTRKNAAFESGGHGRPAALDPSVDFLYRLCPIGTLVEKIENWRLINTLPVKKVYTHLKQDFDAAGDWLPLKRYGAGCLSGYQHITWWSDLELETIDLFSRANRLDNLHHRDRVCKTVRDDVPVSAIEPPCGCVLPPNGFAFERV